MKKQKIFILAVTLFFVFSALDCFSFLNTNKNNSDPEEIVFYSNGSSFSPVIILQSDAEVIWIWDDNTTSNSTTPIKNYGTPQLRKNRLKVTPWSAIRRINIGYTAEDGGSESIERVPDQLVSEVENISVAAPYLKEWCSSYNKIKSLDFRNFINIETIECFRSYLDVVNLVNTPNLKRACFEINNLLTLDLTDCVSLEDLRGAINKYSKIAFPTPKENIWHICIRDNPQFTESNMISNLGQLPNIAELYIWTTNQAGNLTISKTHPTRRIEIIGYNNKYISLDFKGALVNANAYGWVDFRNNKLENVDIEGCIQIKRLELKNNKLSTSEIDKILQQADNYKTKNGYINVQYNQPPSFQGLKYIDNLKAKGWDVQTDPNEPIHTIQVNSIAGNKIATDNGMLQLSASILPADATTKTVSWSVVDVTGKASISASGLVTAEKDGTVKAVATASDGSDIKGEFTITISNQVIPVETISVSSASGTLITTENGTLQLSASILPVDATTKKVSWSVINLTGKASISSSGLVTAEKNGTVKAIATATDGSGVKGELVVTISNQKILVESISIIDNIKQDTIFGIGTILSLRASIIPIDATNQTVTWSVENHTGNASIDNNGSLTTYSQGTIKVIAKANDESNTISLKEYLITIPNYNRTYENSISFRVYSVASNRKIRITLNKMPSDEVILEIRNLIGQKLLEQKIYNTMTELQLNQHREGLYLISLRSKNNLTTKKIYFK